MFGYAKKVFSFLLGISDVSEDGLLEDENEILNAIRSINLGTESGNEDDREERLGQSDPIILPFEKFKCVHKTGKVTHLSDEYGLIDNVIHFVPSQVSSHISLKHNDEVLYTAYKAKDNESERVYKIYALKRDAWENDTGPPESINKLEKTEDDLYTIVRHIPGRVTERKGRDVYIETVDAWCNLDKIQVSFIPIEGDWVIIEAAVALEKDVANFVGDIVEIKSIKPLIKKSSFGRITLWSLIKKEGAIENSIYFSAYACENGYSPNLGDQVVYDAIESDQDTFKWRALVVYPFNKELMEKENTKNDVNSDVVEMASPFLDKNGISIEPSVCGVEVTINDSKILSFEIANKSSSAKRLKRIYLTSNKNSQLEITKKPFRNFFMKPDQRVKVYLTCQGKFLGLSGETCLFHFEEFIVARKIEISVLPSAEMDDLLKCKLDETTNVFEKEPPKQDEKKPDLVLFGPKPWQRPKFISRERQCVFHLPKKLEDIVHKNLRGVRKTKALEQYAPYLKYDLNFDHYADRFHTYLYLEELELLTNFRRYNMNGVFLSRVDDCFSLKVPGLAEGRPSVIIGDSIILEQPWSEGNEIEHVGFIHDILEQEVLIKFHRSFHDSYDESECNIKFIPNTFFFARCHEAIKRAEKVLGEKWLFPSSVNEKPPQLDFELINFIEGISKVQGNQKTPENDNADESPTKNKIPGKRKKKVTFKWVNKDLNDRQKLAVVNVLKGQGRPLPYIIFGPPGTGKTVTLVEIILQIYLLIPGSRILVTTPSNSAADLICYRLIQMANMKPGQLIRLAAITRIIEGNIPENLRPYTTFFRSGEIRQLSRRPMANENIRLCSMNELTGKHRITVSTCSNAGRLHFSGFSTGHFTHILVDEAGQTIEPEALIAATFQNTQSGQVVLAGDPQQLGPVICSRIAKHYGFGESLLQRFTKRFPYAKDIKSFPDTSGFDPRFITRLNVNYRSVPEILSLPSQMFYNSELTPTVSQTESEEANIINKFNFMGDGRDKPAAIVFHGIIGHNYQEPDSPSWFNPQEIWQVVLYLRKLYAIGLKSSDVGILTPYAKQVEKLEDLLDSLNLEIPKIGTVEEYQGQENNVIILSTVRSSLKHVGTDISHHLGFVACPKRLNVSLTRARALLIIVGNPVLLSCDPYWVTVIKYCIENKSYTGCNLKYFNCNLVLGLKKEEEEEGGEEEEEEEKEVKNEGEV